MKNLLLTSVAGLLSIGVMFSALAAVVSKQEHKKLNNAKNLSMVDIDKAALADKAVKPGVIEKQAMLKAEKVKPITDSSQDLVHN